MNNSINPGPPCLLTMPDYSGTLAAVRVFGERGIGVTVAGSHWLAPARWSRYVDRVVSCPQPQDPERFCEWLLDFGERQPGFFLYPTCDDLAWLFASQTEALKRNFVLFQPPTRTMVRLLDKRALQTICAEVGVHTVPTWFPENSGEVERLAREIEMPVLIKPRTQVMLRSRNKGVIVERGSELARRYAEFSARHRYFPSAAKDFGDLSQPMLQAFCSEASYATYSVAGFVDRAGQVLAARASRKLLQRPRRVGVGLCFESAPVAPEALEAVVRVCRAVGYYGVFEVEFVVRDGIHLLIDFNPRYYGQMGFEVARGMPLPLFAWLAACDRQAELERLAVASQVSASEDENRVYCFRVPHEFLLALRRAAGTTSRDEYAHWRKWSSNHAGRMLDFSEDSRDRIPALVHVAADLWYCARYARGFYAGCVLDKS
ncbi:MAG TPA: hypothetical protein VGM44_08545 [Polyangiaceae bacterium]